MVYRYRITLAGIKGFFRVYAVNARNSLYTFHKQLCSDLEFQLDQPVLFKALDGDGTVIARYALVDIGYGTIDDITFADAVKDASNQCEAVFFGSVSDCADNTAPSACRSAAWFVGPEGGFTAEEEELMRRAGFHAFHFGNWTLRVETAAVCGIAILADRFAGTPSAR